jgi:hypothetical protein
MDHFKSIENIKIRLTYNSEIDKAFSLLKGAALWLKDKIIDYWKSWIDPSDSYVNWVKE